MEEESYEKRRIFLGWQVDGPGYTETKYSYKHHPLVTTGGVISAYECEETGVLVMDYETYERSL